MTRDELVSITGKLTASAQVRWFKERLRVDVAFDKRGPILTNETFDKLVAKANNVLPIHQDNQAGVGEPRGTVKLRRRA